MKTKIYTFILIILNFVSFSLEGQNLNEKSILNREDSRCGECKILKSNVLIEDNIATKTFEIEISESGEYYMDAWALGTYDEKSRNMNSYNVSIDGDKSVTNKLNFGTTGWHSSKLKDIAGKGLKKIRLEAGKHKITFSCEVPHIPNVEFIKLSKDELKAQISDKKYRAYIDSIETTLKNRKINNQSVVLQDTSNISRLKSTLSSFSENYYYDLNVTYAYSFYATVYYTKGSVLLIKTSQSTIGTYIPYVIEVFSESNPEGFSFKKLVQTSAVQTGVISIPTTGYYFVKLRSYNREPCFVDVTINDSKYYHVPLNNTGFRHPHETGTTYNYFTSNATGDPRLWLEDDNGYPGYIRAWNDDYNGDGNFNWRANSRIKKDFSVRIGAAHVTSFSSYEPTGTCDLYMMCQNSDIYSSSNSLGELYFPNLNADDAIQSALQSSAYNCASWAGGRTNLGRFFWASNSSNSNNSSSPWYDEDFWKSWENYFGNMKDGEPQPRFIGAPNYTQVGATASNGEIAMWYNETTEQYTHFSVAKPANEQPHGYNWESKPGGLMRAFHPKDALANNSYIGYGSIKLYFTRTNATQKIYIFEESVALGLTIKQEVTLDTIEIKKIKELKKYLSNNEQITFDNKFDALVRKSISPDLIVYSNPEYLYETTEFKEILKYSEEKGERIWPILFEKVFDEKSAISSEIAAILINEITPEYKHLMMQVKDEWKKNCYSKGGSYIAPSSMNNSKNYIKKLLSIADNNLKSTPPLTSTKLNDSHETFSVHPNPFKEHTSVKFVINEESVVSLEVYDLNGRLMSTVIKDQKILSGKHSIEWSAGNLTSGLYIFKLNINNNIFCRRFLIE